MVAKEHKFFYIYKFSLSLRNESGSLFPPFHPITKSGTMADLGSIEKSVESELQEVRERVAVETWNRGNE